MIVHLLPTTLGRFSPSEFSGDVLAVYRRLQVFVVETPKAFRSFIGKTIPDIDQSSIEVWPLPDQEEYMEWRAMWQFLKNYPECGFVSDAGNPCVADPGWYFVQQARQKGHDIKPYPGPSSIVQALMASGMSGQNFHFQGYLPRNERNLISQLKHMQKRSRLDASTQIFMETPYRNEKMFKTLCDHLSPETRLCIAVDISLETEEIRSMTIREWQKTKIDLHKRPAVYVMSSMG